MSDPSGFATPEQAAPGPRRQGATPDPDLEALLAQYAEHRNITPAQPAPSVLPVDDTFQAPPVSAFDAAHLSETPSGFTMPEVGQALPGLAPVSFDALVEAGD